MGRMYYEIREGEFALDTAKKAHPELFWPGLTTIRGHPLTSNYDGVGELLRGTSSARPRPVVGSLALVGTSTSFGAHMTIGSKSGLGPTPSSPFGLRGYSTAQARSERAEPKLGTKSFVIVGGGIVGLAVGRHLLDLYPGATVTVIEKEAQVGAHQTGHNSGVVHAGVYYPSGSLKAQLCKRGRELLKEACEKWSLPYVQCGKLIIAREDSELPALRRLEERRRQMGCPVCVGSRAAPSRMSSLMYGV